MSILELLAGSGPAGVTEIATELGVHKSTVFRLLGTLEARGLVEQDIERGKYRIGNTAVQLARGAAKLHDVAEIGRPVCHQLAAAVGEAAALAIRDADRVITVHQVLGGAVVSSTDWVGKGQPLHATAAGKVFLAALDPAELEALLAAGLAAHTPNTITDPAVLRDQVATVRKQGYATVYAEYEAGLVAIAAPVRDLAGEVVAALAVSGPEFRVNAQTVSQLLPALEAAAAQLSWRLGSVKRG